MAKNRGASGGKNEGKVTAKRPRSAEEPLLLVKSAHKKAVTALAFAPDGQTLVSGGDDKAVRLWDAASGKSCYCGVMDKAPWGIAEIAFSPDGRVVAVVSRGVKQPRQGHTKAFLWNLIKRQVVELEPGGAAAFQFRSPTFAPGGDFVAFLYQGLCLYDTASGRRVGQLPTEGAGDRIAYSPDGRCLVFGESKGALQVFESVKSKAARTLEGHTDFVTSLAFSPDGRWLASASSSYGQTREPPEEDRSVRLWDFPKGKQVRRWDEGWEITSHVTFLADNRHLVSFHDPHGDARLFLWATDEKEALASWSPGGGVTSVAVWSATSSGRRARGLIATGHEDGTVQVWDIAAVLPAPGLDVFETDEVPAEPARQPSPSPKKAARGAKPPREEEEDYFSS